jgi:hypothetical protein
MAGCVRLWNLAPLKACTRLRKLDLRGCSSDLSSQVEYLKLGYLYPASDPGVSELEGLVHELQPRIPSSQS